MVKVLEILYKISKQFVKYELRLFLLNGQIHTCEEALPYIQTPAIKGIF